MAVSTAGPGCSIPPSISNGYPTVSGSGTPKSYTFICNPGYTMSGSPTFTCYANAWYGDAECKPWYVKDVWFWLLIGIGSLLAIAGITALCVYCVRRCCWRNRVQPMTGRNGDDEVMVGWCGGCCDYGGSCDVCGCIDYYGCCSLYGCCGYKGCCSFCFGCCRCCREPDAEHVHSNGPRNLPRRGRTLSRRTSMKKRRKMKQLWRLWKESERPRNPMNEEVYDKVRKQAKVVAIWMPHKHPVRKINTSTK